MLGGMSTLVLHSGTAHISMKNFEQISKGAEEHPAEARVSSFGCETRSLLSLVLELLL